MCYLLTEIALPTGKTISLPRPAIIECRKVPHSTSVACGSELLIEPLWSVKISVLEEVWNSVKASRQDFQPWVQFLLEALLQAHKNKACEDGILHGRSNPGSNRQQLAKDMTSQHPRVELPEDLRMTVYPLRLVTEREKTIIDTLFAKFKAGKGCASPRSEANRSLISRLVYNDCLYLDEKTTSLLRKRLKIRGELSLEISLQEFLYGEQHVSTINLLAEPL